MNENLKDQLQFHWKTIVATVIVCSGIFGFIYNRMLDIKNAHIALFETQIRLFETRERLLKDRIEELESKNKQEIENRNIGLKNKSLKAKSVTKNFTLHKDGIYQFPFNEDYSLKITEFNNLKEVKVEFNLGGIIKTESLQINKTRSFLVDDKKYNFLLKKISEAYDKPVAEFSVVIKNID